MKVVLAVVAVKCRAAKPKPAPLAAKCAAEPAADLAMVGLLVADS